MTNICIFGAGAIGGYLACSLKKTNANVSLIARGAHKNIIQNEGLKLIKNNVEETHKFLVTDTPSNLPLEVEVCNAPHFKAPVNGKVDLRGPEHGS